MSLSIDQIINILNEIRNFKDFEKHKDAIVSLLRSIGENEDFLNFKYERSLKDKNVVFSLLNKTSDDLKKANSELINRAKELDTLLNTIPALVFFKDMNLKYVIVNKAYCQFVDQKVDAIIGKNIDEIFTGHDSHNEYRKIEKEVIKEGKSFYNIEEKIRRNSEDIWVSTNLAPVINQSGKTIGLIGVSWDKTEQHDYETELRTAKDKAIEGTKVKNQFLANISHEIRTPLNGIIGMSQILTKTDLDKKQEDYLSILINSGDSLLSLVNDILDFSKIEAGESELDVQDFNFKGLLNDIKNIIEVKASEKGLEFDLIISPDFPEWVHGDNYKIKQIILNLAKNAIKFTRSGKIKIIASLEKKTKTGFNIQIKVSDSGIGIEKDKIANLFDGFYQLDASTTRKYGGTGLGLAICKKLAEMMGGKINVESTYGKGSDFWVNIKLAKPKEKNNIEIEIIDQNPQKLTVLLAEDNLVNQKVMEFSIKQIGFNIEIANNGVEAIKKYSNNKYHFILMDLQMPIMNGFDATIEIRKIQESEPRDHIPIIALTANATKADRKRSFDAGMDGFMSKPFDPFELKKLLSKLSVL